MNMKFYRKLPIPQEVKEMIPVPENVRTLRDARIGEIKEVLSGKSDRFLLLIGPCSADSEAPVMEYLHRLAEVRERVSDRILIVPRLYTNKPRTTGEGYQGMFLQPDPAAEPDLFNGILATRKLHLRVLSETGFGCADEMLYPENHRYLSDLIAYVAVGARSVENQQHRLTASGLEIPVGMKNPTGGDLTVLLHSIRAAQAPHRFLYRGWDAESTGNPYAHAILRGYRDFDGNAVANCDTATLLRFAETYSAADLKNTAVIVDASHDNSAKCADRQIPIAKAVLEDRRNYPELRRSVRGLMIESYLTDGAQLPEKNRVYGKSVTDPCIGWEKTERLIFDLYELLNQTPRG